VCGREAGKTVCGRKAGKTVCGREAGKTVSGRKAGKTVCGRKAGKTVSGRKAGKTVSGRGEMEQNEDSGLLQYFAMSKARTFRRTVMTPCSGSSNSWLYCQAKCSGRD
jgi:hypothetical protein